MNEREDRPQDTPHDTTEDSNQQEPQNQHFGEENGMKNRGQGSKFWMISSIVLAAVLVYTLIFPPFGAKEQVVATVNGVEITQDAHYDKMAESGGEQTLDLMIDEELIRQETEKAGVQVSEQDIEAEIEKLKASFGSDEMFEQALAQYGMTLENLKADVKVQLGIKKILEPDIKVTEEEAQAFFEQNKAYYEEPEMVKASHILVATQEEAEAVLKRLENGEDFAAVAKEVSMDPGSKEAGGDLDYFPRGVMHEEFEEAAFNLEVGKISGIVQTSDGFHIIKVTDHQEAKSPTYEEKKDEIHEQLLNQKISEQSQIWIAEIKEKATIEKL